MTAPHLLADLDLIPPARFLGEDATRRQLEHLAKVNGGTVHEEAWQTWPWGSTVAALPDGSRLRSRALDGDVFAIAHIQPNGSWALIHQAADARGQA